MKYGKPRKIFAVDDDPIILSMLQDYLTKDIAHEIQVYSTGEECLKNMNQNPEIVILDYELSKDDRSIMNGMDVLQTIRKHYPDVYIIMLSNQERYGVALQAMQKGAVQYFIKDAEAFEKIASMINEIK